MTIRRIVTDVSVVAILAGFGLMIWQGTRAVPSVHPAVFFLAGAVVAMLLQLAGPPLIRATFPRHVLDVLPLDIFHGPIPAGTPRGYRELIRVWRRGTPQNSAPV